MAAREGYKAKRIHDDYDGAQSSNYELHPKRIERLTDLMAHGNLTVRSQVNTKNVVKS